MDTITTEWIESGSSLSEVLFMNALIKPLSRMNHERFVHSLHLLRSRFVDTPLSPPPNSPCHKGWEVGLYARLYKNVFLRFFALLTCEQETDHCSEMTHSFIEILKISHHYFSMYLFPMGLLLQLWICGCSIQLFRAIQ